jgi:RNA polymerase sigma-70 factor (ECF subfamily)
MEAVNPGRSDLVLRAQSGDDLAFQRLVEPELSRLVRLASAIVGNETDARDVIQDTLTIAWRKVGSLRDEDRFQAWLTRILINECRHLVRRRGNHTVREAPRNEGAHGGSYQSQMERDVASSDLLERAFDRLEGRQRALLVLHHLEGLPIDQIAGLIDVPPGTVKSQLFTARAALKAALAREESDGR